MQKKILIAVDGSIYSSQSLDYLTQLFKDSPETSFHIISCVSSGGGVIESSADQADSLIPTNGDDKKQGQGHEVVTRARDRLIRHGIVQERISCETVTSGYNYGAAIQHLGEAGLMDAIVIGRRGLGTLSKMLLGSVSETLVQGCHEVPVWLIDGEINDQDILLPVDGSLPSMLAADHLAHILAGRSDVKVHLFHCSRFMHKKVLCRPEDFYEHWDQDWCDQHLADGGCLFNGPAQLLKEAGIPEEQIEILPTVMDLDEAHAIVVQARKQHCGTIVIGRRGRGIAKGILGGVSDRTARHAQDVALWLVG